jgi:DNA-binding LacI/PurR family transcriptional regulator
MPPAAPKYAGYKPALAQAGLGARAELIETAATSRSSQATAALRLLTRAGPPTAIVTASDSLAIGTIRAARQLGLPIPDRLALVGNDNTASARDTAAPLTTIDARAAEMGVHAIGMPEQLIAEQPLEHTPHHTRHPTRRAAIVRMPTPTLSPLRHEGRRLPRRSRSQTNKTESGLYDERCFRPDTPAVLVRKVGHR